MIHPLVRKELREHRVVLIFMWLLCGLGVLVLLAIGAMTSVSPLTAYRNLIISFGVMLSLALANRFVVREYGGRTQLFLETLPVSRAQVISWKWLTSALCMLVPMAAGFAIILLVAAGKVELTSRFLLILVLRGGMFLLFFHALAFLIGLTGRYRYLIWIALALLVTLVNFLGLLPAEQLPPFKLVSGSLPFEREVMPVGALWITAGATIALIAGAFALALGFQGSWVVALSRRMSLREKGIATAVVLSVVFIFVELDSRKPKTPFALQDAVSSPEGGPTVNVARAQFVGDDAALRLAARLAADLADLRDYLGLTRLPVVAVLPDAAVDTDQFLLAKLPTSDGVVVRTAFGSEQFDELALRTFTVARVISWHSKGRAERDQRGWLLDGYSAWRIARDDVGRRELFALRAAVAAEAIGRQGSMTQALQHWSATREELGECLAEALAWRATEQMFTSMGDEPFRKQVRALAGASWGQDSAAPSLSQLSTQLEQVLKADREKFAARIAAVQHWPVKFSTVAMRGSTYELRYEITAPATVQYAVRYARLGPWDGEIARADLERVDAMGPGVLPASFPRGTRLLAAVEVQDPQLGCAVRLGPRRWELQ